ncbi:MAG: NHL repeat-containing protein [Acidimicrobiales bacterium]
MSSLICRAGAVGAVMTALLVGSLTMFSTPQASASSLAPTWSLDASPSLSTSATQDNGLGSVSCVSEKFCVAVGYYANPSSRPQDMVLVWNGTRWLIDSSPSLSTAASGLTSVSCASVNFCVATGYQMNASGNPQNLLLTWNGSTWTLDTAASLSTSGTQFNMLYSISCASVSFCVAVGTSVTGSGNPQTALLIWNGSNWKLDTAASLSTPTGQPGGFMSISCTSASFCVAAGSYSPDKMAQNLLLVWNGNTWSLDTASSLSTSTSQFNELKSVSCASASFCVAAGFFYNGTTDKNLVLTWNGSKWSLDAQASLSTSGTGADILRSVSCTSQSFCVAGGKYTDIAGQTQNMVLTWNGSTWSLDSAASLSTSSTKSNSLSSVSCVGSSFCVATGAYKSASIYQNLILAYSTSPMSPSGIGYWFVASDGGIFSFGGAKFYGSMGAKHLNAPIVGMAATPDGKGYWFVASDGGIFSFGDAHFYGSMGAKHLNAPIVGMAATPDGKGYWFVASDGGIFSFGDAKFYGSMGAKHLNAPIVGMAATPDGKGYWFVASDGGIFSFGDAKFYGSMGAKHLNKPIVGMAATPDGKGYWFVASDGGIFSFGDAKFYGSMGAKHLNKPIVGMAATPDGKGYWFVASDGGIFSFGDAKFYGSMGAKHLNQPIVGMATS